MSGKYLLRAWGADIRIVEAIRTPDAIERSDGPRCYWFDSVAERAAFLAQWPDVHPESFIPQGGVTVVRDKWDPGMDDDGEEIFTEHLTVADVVLESPDGQRHAFSQTFGYGYPAHSVEFMFVDGNYSCDCNRSAMAGLDELPCGDTLTLVSLSVRKEPRDDTKPTVRISLVASSPKEAVRVN